MSSTAKFRWYFAAAALACVSLAGPAPAPQGSGAITSQIDLDEPVTSVLFGDVDGDGLKDMVLLLERRLAIHKLRADHTYPPKPDYVVKLPADAVAVDLPNFDPKNKKATLLAATARGLFTRDLSKPDAPFESLGIPELPGALFPRASGALPVALALTADFDGDGSLELLVPLASGLGVLRRFADGWRWIGTADAPVAANVESGEDRPGAVLQQTFELPRVATLDAILPGGKRVKYLTVTRDLDSWVYRVDAESLVAIEHARGLFRFDSEDKFRAVRGTRRNEETNDRSVGLVPADLNGDGIPDFVSSRFRDGQVFLTIGRPGSFTADAPDRVIDADGWVVLAQARDFDGDGRPDLLVPRLPKLGIAGALKVLLSRKISLDLWVFRNTGDARIVGETPDWKTTFDVEVVLGGDEGKFTASARLMAGFHDVNGDGLADFVTARDDKELVVFAGSRAKILEQEPIRVVPIPNLAEWPENDLRACDVDGDGREDLLVIYGANRKGAKNKLFMCVWK
jgi:hypothetical protein